MGGMIIGNLDRDGYLVLDPDGPTALEQEAQRSGLLDAGANGAAAGEGGEAAHHPDAIDPKELVGLDELKRAEQEVAELTRELRVSGKSSQALDRAQAALSATEAAKEISHAPKKRVVRERKGGWIR